MSDSLPEGFELDGPPEGFEIDSPKAAEPKAQREELVRAPGGTVMRIKYVDGAPVPEEVPELKASDLPAPGPLTDETKRKANAVKAAVIDGSMTREQASRALGSVLGIEDPESFLSKPGGFTIGKEGFFEAIPKAAGQAFAEIPNAALNLVRPEAAAIDSIRGDKNASEALDSFRKTQKERQDFLYGSGEKAPSVAGRVAGGAGAIIPLAVATGGAGLAADAALGARLLAAAKGAASFAVPAGINRTGELVDDGVPLPKAIGAGAVTAAGNEALGLLPAGLGKLGPAATSLVGGVARRATGAAAGFGAQLAGNEGLRRAENAVLPEDHQQAAPDLETALIQAAPGAAFGALHTQGRSGSKSARPGTFEELAPLLKEMDVDGEVQLVAPNGALLGPKDQAKANFENASPRVRAGYLRAAEVANPKVEAATNAADETQAQFLIDNGFQTDDVGRLLDREGEVVEGPRLEQLQKHLAQANEAAARVVAAGRAPTVESIREDLRHTQRLNDLQSDLGAAQTDAGKRVVQKQIDALQAGRVERAKADALALQRQQEAGDLQRLAAQAADRGDAEARKAYLDEADALARPAEPQAEGVDVRSETPEAATAADALPEPENDPAHGIESADQIPEDITLTDPNLPPDDPHPGIEVGDLPPLHAPPEGFVIDSAGNAFGSPTESNTINSRARRIKKSDEVEFTTAKGSTYKVNSDGTTSRNKAPRPEHPGDSGPQPKSESTFYVTAADAIKLGEVQARGGARRTVAHFPNDRKAAVKYLDGKDAGKLERRTAVDTHSDPAVGLTPVELFKDGSVHFGNEITEVRPSLTARKALPHLTDAEHDVATRAGKLHPGNVDRQAVASLAHLIENEPETAQRLLDENHSTADLAAAVHAHTEQAGVDGESGGEASPRADAGESGEPGRAGGEISGGEQPKVVAKPKKPRPAPKTARQFAENHRLDLLAAIRKLGGIDQAELPDIAGEGRRNKNTGRIHTSAGGQIRALFTKDGASLDQVIEKLDELGYFPKLDNEHVRDDGDVTGNAQRARDLIRAALEGDSDATVPPHAAYTHAEMLRIEHNADQQAREAYELTQKDAKRLALQREANQILPDEQRAELAERYADDDDYFKHLEEALDEQRVSAEDHGRGEVQPEDYQSDDSDIPFSRQAGDRSSGDLFGTNETAQAVADRQREKDAARNGKDGAAPAEEFRLSGSNRPADVAVARGQKSLFNRGNDNGEAPHIQRAQNLVNLATKDWANKPDIQIIDSLSDPKSPAAARKADEAARSRGAKGDVLGFIHAGKVYINAAAARSPRAIVETLYHESLGHYGLRGAYGKALENELKTVALLRAKDVQSKLSEYGMTDMPKNRLRAAEEVLARMAQTHPELPVVKRAIAAIRNALRPVFERLGIKLELTDNDIIQKYLLPARRFVKEGGEAVDGDLAFHRAEAIDQAESGKDGAVDFNRESDDDYRGLHQAPDAESGAPLHDLTNVYPDDIYSSKGAQYYGHHGGNHPQDVASIHIIQSLRGKPNADVKMYRAVPNIRSNAQKIELINQQKAEYLRRGKIPADSGFTNGSRWYEHAANEIERLKSLPETSAPIETINPGDWVTINRAYARDHGESTLLGDYKIISKTVKARDLYTNGDSIHEFGYSPTERQPKVKTAAPAEPRKAPRETQDGNDSIDFARGDGDLPEATRAPEGVKARKAFSVGIEEKKSTFGTLFSDPGAAKRFIRNSIGDNLGELFDRQAAVEKTRKLADNENPHDTEIASHGRIRNQVEELQKKYFEPALNALKGTKLTAQDFADFLYARHAPERNAFHSRDGISGLTNLQARNLIAEFSLAERETLEKAAGFVDALHNNKLDTLVDAGVISADARARLKAAYKHYVPLKTVESESHLGVNLSSNTTLSPISKVKGRDTAATDPLSVSVRDAVAAIVVAEQNKVRQAAVRFVEKNPAPDAYEIIPPNKLPRKDDGTVDYGVIKNDPHLFGAKFEGQDRIFRIHDEDLARQLHGYARTHPLPYGAEHVLRAVGAGTRALSTLYTTLSLNFVLKNAARDVQHALSISSGLDVPDPAGFSKRLAKSLPGAYKEGLRHFVGELRGIEPKGEGAERYRQFKADGGTTGGYGLTDVETIAKRATDLIAAAQGNKVALAKNIALKPLQLIEGFNNVFENAARYAAYKSALENGLTRQKAAVLAKNITVNFDKKGESTRVFNSIYAFFNASVQGVHGIISAAPKSRVVQAALGTYFVAGILNEILPTEVDEDGNKKIDYLSAFKRDSNVVLPLGNDRFATVPVAQGFNVPFYAGRHLVRLIRGDETAGKAASGLIAAAMRSYLPLSGNNPIDALTPTVLKPYADVDRNKSFTDSKIYPDERKDRPLSQQHFAGANEIFENIAKALYAGTGGGADVHGASIEYVAKGYLGGPFKTLSDLLTLASGNAKAEDIPIASGFLAEKNPSFEERNADKIVRDIDARRTAITKDGAEAKPGEQVLIAMIRGIDKDVDRIQKAKATMLKANPKADTAEIDAALLQKQKSIAKFYNAWKAKQ